MEKVLIIENSHMMRLFLANHLGRDYEVTTVETTKEALQYLSEGNTPQLIVADYYQKGSEQFQALERMKNHMKWRNIPMIVLADNDKSEQRLEAFSMGANDCLSKPFNPIELTFRAKNHSAKSEVQTQYRTVA